jgi:D-alanyl-D-alanine carboxypeptidase/D-alanyl-D-alanine-endopeptidase (penicillin-binding protein 4)
VRNPLRLALFCILAVAGVAVGEETVAQRIEAVVNGPDYKQAHWGILVVNAKTGETIYEHNADKLCTPASTTKLYSCATALATFGPDYKFATPVYQRGELKGDRLAGDLILVAGGDLTLGGRTKPNGSMAFANYDHTYAGPATTDNAATDTDPLAGLRDLARQVRRAGIRHVSGDILIDDRMFPQARGSGSGPDLITPIMVNDNVIDLTVTPASKPGELASVKMRPETAFVQMDAQVQTAAEGTSPMINVVATGPQRFTVRGRIAGKSKPLLRVWYVDDPTAFARALFIEALRAEGVTVIAGLHARPESELPPRDAYDKLTRVAVFTSPPLSEAIKVTLKVSHNLYASTLPVLVAHKHGQQSIADGLRRQRQFMLDLGVPVETISFAGGAGGTNADCTTARATVKLLQGMRARKEYDA